MTITEISSDLIVSILSNALEEVFSSMLSTEVTVSEARELTDSTVSCDGVLAFVGFTGSYVGSGSLFCSSATACELASRFMACEYPTVNEEVLDAIGELTNMIVGSAKNAIEDRLGPIQMSIPTSMFGKNMSVRNTKTDMRVLVHFHHPGGEGVVTLSIAKSSIHSALSHLS